MLTINKYYVTVFDIHLLRRRRRLGRIPTATAVSCFWNRIREQDHCLYKHVSVRWLSVSLMSREMVVETYTHIPILSPDGTEGYVIQSQQLILAVACRVSVCPSTSWGVFYYSHVSDNFCWDKKKTHFFCNIWVESVVTLDVRRPRVLFPQDKRVKASINVSVSELQSLPLQELSECV
jgi:hypothetical protein